MADLFELDDLRKALQMPVAQFDTEAAIVARRRAWSWLMSPTGLSTWPDPVPENLWGWAIDLAVIAYDNPTANASESTGGVSTTKDRARRGQILEEARLAYNSEAGRPQGSFPPPDWSWTTTAPSTLHD